MVSIRSRWQGRHGAWLIVMLQGMVSLTTDSPQCNATVITIAWPSVSESVLWVRLRGYRFLHVFYTVSCTFSYHTWQFIIFTIFTITTCIFSYSLSVSFWTQDLVLQQILSSIDLFLYYQTDYTRTLGPFNVFTLLNVRLYWYKCVRLSRLLAFECT